MVLCQNIQPFTHAVSVSALGRDTSSPSLHGHFCKCFPSLKSSGSTEELWVHPVNPHTACVDGAVGSSEVSGQTLTAPHDFAKILHPASLQHKSPRGFHLHPCHLRAPQDDHHTRCSYGRTGEQRGGSGGGVCKGFQPCLHPRGPPWDPVPRRGTPAPRHRAQAPGLRRGLRGRGRERPGEA